MGGRVAVQLALLLPAPQSCPALPQTVLLSSSAADRGHSTALGRWGRDVGCSRGSRAGWGALGHSVGGLPWVDGGGQTVLAVGDAHAGWWVAAGWVRAGNARGWAIG